MIMHVLKQNNILFDYLVGAKIDGFDNMVSLSNKKIIIIEGDEYFSSKLFPNSMASLKSPFLISFRRFLFG